jgi:hypothetical protein
MAAPTSASKVLASADSHDGVDCGPRPLASRATTATSVASTIAGQTRGGVSSSAARNTPLAGQKVPMWPGSK